MLRQLRWLWLVVCPFLAIALLAACLPPGVLWREEAGGYDVLEYHLAVPKIFFDQGRALFLPHNVYSNFPLASEMLSLLMMTLRGDPIEASFMATIVNVGLAGLFVAAAWRVGRLIIPAAGVAAGVLAGTAPWIAYLAGIAYVEVGLLALGMCALAAAARAARSDRTATRGYFAAGLLAGLACGFKYPAVPLIACPMALLALFASRPWPKRLVAVLVVAVGTLISFSPWMIRNLVNTHNPVFPLAYSVFGAREGTWDADLEARWQQAHSPAGAGREEGSIAARAWQRTVGDFRLGWPVVLLAILGALTHRNRFTLALLAMLCVQVVVWLTLTHLYARFAVVMLLPLIALSAGAIGHARSAARVRLVAALLIAGAGWNLYRIATLYYDHTHPGGYAVHAYGRTDWFVQGEWPGTQHLAAINGLGDDAKVMMVGDARSYYVKPPCEAVVVFNHHPLAAAVRRYSVGPGRAGTLDARAVLRWLNERGMTHVFVHWSEVQRLRRTYGFYPELNEALFEELSDEGLTLLDAFAIEPGGPIYATLYEVPPEPPPDG